MADWPWQLRSVELVRDAWRNGSRAVCLTVPTGMGKGQISIDLVRPILETFGRAVILSNRRMLTSQLSERLENESIEHGFVASGYSGGLQGLNVVSAQTARSRGFLPDADIVIPDEAHRKDFDKVVDYYKEETNALICGLTATPIGLSHYDRLIVGGTKAEGRKYGALVPCRVYAPSEPDIKGIRRETKKVEAGGLLFNNIQHFVFGDVLDYYLEIQERHRADFPGGMPAIFWAPGVPESRWFAGSFSLAGVQGAHIDGSTPKEERQRIRDGSCPAYLCPRCVKSSRSTQCGICGYQRTEQGGSIKVVCSMGVLREGIDWPWLAHGLCVQTWGELLTFLQCAGRILRACIGKPYAVLQEHAGVWWRLGSPNRDIEWELGDTAESVEKKLKAPAPKNAQDTPEGIICPKCKTVRAKGPACPTCGYQHTQSIRMVMMESGELKAMEGSPNYEPPAVPKDDYKVWTSCLYACANSGKTLGQAVGLFKSKTGHDPVDLPNVPGHGTVEWHRKVADVHPKFYTRKEKV